MPGETNLAALLGGLRPQLHAGVYVFVHWPLNQPLPSGTTLATFREAEGYTLIVPQAVADEACWPYTYRAAWITLQVHSALEAVGLTAAVARVLAEAGISCNVWAANYHDHIFVAAEQAERAIAALYSLNKRTDT
jgi:hypothetical protein